MSRGLSANNLAEISAAHLTPVALVKFEFDTPVYVHSGIGTITYDGNAYTGVGTFGNVSQARESELLSPAPLTFSIAATEAALVAEALDAGNFRDKVTLYIGYRQDDGTLVADPWVAWSGFYDSAQVSIDADVSSIAITAQHDLTELSEKHGGRYSDEDQQNNYAGDLGLEYVVDMAYVNLAWGKPVLSSGSTGGTRRDRTFQVK